MAPPDTPQHFRFRNFDLDVAGYRLSRNGRPIRIERQPMDLLILLVANRQRLVTRAEIVDALWGKDVFVDVETGVHTAIRKIRLALHDSPESPTFVETVSGKGYRFVAPVEEALAEAVGAVAPPVVEPPPQRLAVSESGPWPRRAAIGVIALVIVAGLAGWAWRVAQHPADATVTVAVLPFQNLSGDAERDYLVDGFTEETIVAVGHLDPARVSVIGRTSMMQYKRTTKSLIAIAGELHADYFVECSMRTEAGRLRMTARLIRARDQLQLWSDSYNREPESMLGFQQELSLAIAEQVRLRLSPERVNALARRQTRNADAYDLYLRGLNLINQRTPPTTRRGIEYFQRATALDPGYALAWAGLASAYVASTINGDADPRVVAAPAKAALMNATRAGSDLADVQYVIGQSNWLVEWNWPMAESAFRRAAAGDASHAMAYMHLGHLLSQTRRHSQAQEMMRRARELDPKYAMPYAMSSQVAFQAGNYPLALEYARQTITLDPDFWIGHLMLAQAYEQLGQATLALDPLTAAARFSGGNSKTLSLRGYLLAKAGRVTEARELLATLDSVSRQRYVPPYTFAVIHAGLGEREAVFEWLERAYTARDVHLIYLPVDAKWDAYRDDPRFIALLARCNFMRTARSAARTQ